MSNFDTFFPYARTFRGTWTPTLEDESGNAATVTATGHFRKNGNEVHINFSIVTSSIAGLTLGERVFIKGLPFTGQLATVLSSSLIANLTINGTDGFPVVIMDPAVATDALIMRYRVNDATSDSPFTVAQWSATAQILCSGFYISPS